MSKRETLRNHILKQAHERRGEAAQLRILQLASQFEMPVAHVEEELVDMVNGSLIGLERFTWTTGSNRAIKEWENVRAFFDSKDDAYVLVRIRSRGSEFVEELGKGRIGFVPS
jgi:hypothetical protein